MKVTCKPALVMLGLMIFCSAPVFAKVWRVNNNPGVSADFTQLLQAVNSASVVNDDTLYVEGTTAAYGNFTLHKRLVIIGTGYFLGENTGLQVSTNDSWITAVTLDSLSSGSRFYGLRVNQVLCNSNTDNILLSRCHLSVSPNSSFVNSKMANWQINKCYLGSFNLNNAQFPFDNLQITNCIISLNFAIATNTNGLLRNNIVLAGLTVPNFYVANNIFLNGSTLSFTNCTVKHNISQSNNLPGTGNNLVNILPSNLFTLAGSTDGRYQLKAGSPAIGAGEPVGGLTPDCGAFGTADPYRLSGIPPIPSIYALTIPSTIPSSATSMTIILSTRSNN